MGKEESVVVEAASSVAHKPLPPMPKNLKKDQWGNWPVTLVLFYQYVEPMWTEKEHKEALAFAIGLAKEHGCTGRGRCSAEGLNCTLTGPAQSIRNFCYGLRKWNPIFNETDFKLTDGVPYGQRFKALTIRKTEELVAYGLGGVEKAPLLKSNRAEHLEATDYHKMMERDDTVIIDVRNAYESAIGHFQPPPGGAELIDPKMRNSHEFPKWLNAPETQEKLRGKKVMMYCTGGIRCERATALLDQMEKAIDNFDTQGIVMVRGGIERYLKTYPEGGYWKGKNYLFDRRLEQVPEKKSEDALAADVESWCCICHAPEDKYRGQFKCAGKIPTGRCDVPVLVCAKCRQDGKDATTTLLCPLCAEGYIAPQQMPNLSHLLKDQKGLQVKEGGACKANERKQRPPQEPSTRLFVGNLPFIVTASAVKGALGSGVEMVHWLSDRKTGLFYGSVFVKMADLEQAKQVMERAGSDYGVKVDGRKLKINFSPPRADEVWPPAGYTPTERPPINPTAPTADKPAKTDQAGKAAEGEEGAGAGGGTEASDGQKKRKHKGPKQEGGEEPQEEQAEGADRKKRKKDKKDKKAAAKEAEEDTKVKKKQKKAKAKEREKEKAEEA